MNPFIPCISAFIACIGFSFIFRVHENFRFAIAGSLIGALGYLIYLLCNFMSNTFLQTFLAMLSVALFAEALARLYKAPASIFVIIGCFPLVPGSGIYYTMLYAVEGEEALFINSLLSTLGISLSIAFAILISSTMIDIYRRIKSKHYEPIA